MNDIFNFIGEESGIQFFLGLLAEVHPGLPRGGGMKFVADRNIFFFFGCSDEKAKWWQILLSKGNLSVKEPFLMSKREIGLGMNCTVEDDVVTHVQASTLEV